MTCHDLAAILDEGFEQVIFCGRQLDFLSVDLDEAMHKINAQWPGCKDGFGAGFNLGGMAQRNAYTSQDFIHSERFGNIVIGPQIKRLHFIALGILDREHNDR